MSDLWDAFGDEDDDDDDENETLPEKLSAVDPVALFLTQHFVPYKVPLSTIRIHLVGNTNEAVTAVWKSTLETRGFAVNQGDWHLCDVVLVMTARDDTDNSVDEDKVSRAIQTSIQMLVPGGVFIAREDFVQAKHSDPALWNVDKQETISDASTNVISSYSMVALTRWPCEIQAHSCPWLASSHDDNAERVRAAQACVVRTAAEREGHALSETSIQAAVHRLRKHGYCIVPGLLDAKQAAQWGETALADLHEAADILQTREGVDLIHPQLSTQEPASYRELSMREDLRMDLRHGPRLDLLRGRTGGEPWTITARTELRGEEPHDFLRGNPYVLQVIRRTMNPVDDELSPGNFGRYNFSGTGPDGSFQDVRVGPVGAIVSLPGSADQALHADTPHLFEHHDCLPAHYINVFTPGCAADALVGQTALVHGSHHLSLTARYASSGWSDFVVRPLLQLGDVLLFDCRILHFGLANISPSIERPLLYTNVTQHWFHDPKNWNDRRRIFSESAVATADDETS
jgi:hypothetical protein